jgi:predicted transcriptional regulator
MRHSELDYIEILKVLSYGRQQKLTNLTHKLNLNYQKLKEQLEFLKGNGLIEEKTPASENAIYSITMRGTEILKAFREIVRVSPAEHSEKQEAPQVIIN